MLVPVIGLVQIGRQAMADRYTYLPQIGLCLALAFTLGQVVEKSSSRRAACAMVCSLALAVPRSVRLAANVVLEGQHGGLWTRTLEYTSANWLAENDLGTFLDGQGQHKEAIAHLQKGVEIRPCVCAGALQPRHRLGTRRTVG